MLTFERLQEFLDYDPQTGLFFWRVRTARCVRIGDLAGSARANGYTQITIEGTNYLAHRLAWFYMKGEWPERDLDHKDRDRSNNAFSNLRLADRSQNKANGSHQKSGSGYRGVDQRGMRYIAMIAWKRRRHYLGTFDTPEEAHAAYCSKAKELFGEFAP